MLAAGIYVGTTKGEPQPYPVSGKVVIDAASCASVLRELGMNSVVNPGTQAVEAEGWVPDNVETRDNLTRISLGMAACKLPVVSFCYKKGCPDAPTQFKVVLSAKDPDAAGKPAQPARSTPTVPIASPAKPAGGT
jgi:hypothetical protein